MELNLEHAIDWRFSIRISKNQMEEHTETPIATRNLEVNLQLRLLSALLTYVTT
jgi:hypothetical protein